MVDTKSSNKNIRILTENEYGYGILIENEWGIDGENKFNKQIIKEATETPEKFLENPIVHCVLQRYDVPNKNKRIYPKEHLLSAVERYMQFVEKQCALGEVDHADSTTISLNNVGLNIKDLYWKDSALMGVVYLPITLGFKKMGICSNPADIVANLICHNILTGISSRAVGSVTKSGMYKMVGGDLQLLCWDFVNMPSTPLAYCYTDQESALTNVKMNETHEAKKPLITKTSKNNKTSYFSHFMQNFK